jgi:hypothetical protein
MGFAAATGNSTASRPPLASKVMLMKELRLVRRLDAAASARIAALISLVI